MRVFGLCSERQAAEARAHQLWGEGNIGDAQLLFSEAAAPTPRLSWLVAQRLKQIGILYTFAPYQSDSQLVHMELEGIIDFSVTEDSDLIAYGARHVRLSLSLFV
jgi:5'-3' exonuclease